ncbi:MAG: DUF4136 domain-containing protein [Desulfosarcina sp.]
MIKKGWIALIGTILLMGGCSGINVSQDYDPTTNFQPLDTFSWATDTQAPSGDPRIDNPLQDARIRKAVERVLKQKGFDESTDSPSFQVRYQYDLRQKIEADGTAGGIGFGIGSYGRHGGIAIGTGNGVQEYDESTLIIDMVAPPSQTLLWRGSGTQRFVEYTDPEKASRDINTLVEKILSQFPPQEN